MKVKDGGPAFPLCKGELHFSNDGMSLRDWFAGMFLSGVSSNGYQKDGHLGLPVADDVAKWSYEYADAMLKEREE